MSRPSGVRVFAKSMHLIAIGWFVCIVWLWAAGLRQHERREGRLPADYGRSVLASGVAAAVILEALAFGMTSWTGRAPVPEQERSEWHHAFWWALCPNLMLAGTVYLMIFAPWM
jgi:hypothetical protein